MIRLVAFFLFCITNVTASNQIPHVPIFSHAALQEFCDGKPSQATCVVIASKSHGSGALVSFENRHVFILTSAHIENPTSVYFMVPDKTAPNVKLDSMQFVVRACFSMQKETGSSFAQDDIQILLLDGNPERHIKPLVLSSEIDTANPLTVYGIGNLVAEFFPGRLSVGIPSQYELAESGAVIRGGLLPAKVMLSNYEVNPIASWLDKIRLGQSLVAQKLISGVALIKISSETGRKDGMIVATTKYGPGKLETHFRSGFSGGPALQNDTVVGVAQGGSLKAEDEINPVSQRLMGYQFLSMWVLYLAGQKLPPLEKVAPFVYDPIISPSIRYVLGRLGYNHLSTPARLCIFNTAVFIALNIYCWAKKMYAQSNHALRKPKSAWFVRLTPDIISWIQSKLEGSEPKLNTAS